MTAQSTGGTLSRAQADPLLTATDPVAAAREHIARTALHDGPLGKVGLELELHVVDLALPERRPSWTEVQGLARDVPPLPGGSTVTLEPGGQIELSTPPGDGVVSAVEALRDDLAVMRASLRSAGYGAAGLGTDLARPVQRINPGWRYLAMEQHFDALGCAGAGRSMMSATAALQVNLDAGPASGWDDRLRLVASMVPVLLAAAATSPYLGGETSGWHTMRQGVWQGIDRGRSSPISDGEPTAAWAFYALSAPIMLVNEGDDHVAVTDRVSFAQWLQGHGPVERPPTVADLDYHLTTLFPPVRPRGYVEIRCLDALPDRWWPAVAAITAVLADDPVAADAAADLCAPVAHAWEAAARDGLADPDVRRAVLGCIDVAARRCPEPLRAEVEAYAELLASGRTPSDLLRARVEESGPHRVMEEEADA